MAYSEEMAERIRLRLKTHPNVTEKKMFGGLAFMVNDRLCITTRNDRIMCRIDPNDHDGLVLQEGCETVVMGKKTYKGYVYVSFDLLTSDNGLQKWISRALAYNERCAADD